MKQPNSFPATIIIPGRSLVSGFCVYIHEIIGPDGQALAYYVGMTGDNHYPSARSPFHRLAGHFDRAAKSTQAQLANALREKLVEHHISDLTIKMHYYPISGYEPIAGATNKKGSGTYFGLPQFARKLQAYYKRRNMVLQLENHIITLFSASNLLLLNKKIVTTEQPQQKELRKIIEDVRERFLR